MIKSKQLINKLHRLNPLSTTQDLKSNSIIKAYHASESPNFVPLSNPLHIGSNQQALSLIKNMKSKYGKKMNFYLYELLIDLGNVNRVLYDEDPQIETSPNNRFDSWPYSNRIEYPEGLKKGYNISIVLANADKQIKNIKLIEKY